MTDKETKALSEALSEWRWICRTRYQNPRPDPRVLLWQNMKHNYLLWGANLAS